MLRVFCLIPMRHATRALNYPVQFNYAETKGIGKYRCGIESGKGAPGKQPPPCGRGSRRAGQARGRKVRYRVASYPVGGGSSKNCSGSEGALGEGQIKASEIEIRIGAALFPVNTVPNVKTPAILSNRGRSYLPLRQLERSQLASPWGLW